MSQANFGSCTPLSTPVNCSKEISDPINKESRKAHPEIPNNNKIAQENSGYGCLNQNPTMVNMLMIIIVGRPPDNIFFDGLQNVTHILLCVTEFSWSRIINCERVIC
jgi:hypothetical protein